MGKKGAQGCFGVGTGDKGKGEKTQLLGPKGQQCIEWGFRAASSAGNPGRSFTPSNLGLVRIFLFRSLHGQ